MNKKYYISLGLLSMGIFLAGGVYFFMIRNVWEKALTIATYKNDIMFAGQKKQYAEKMISSFENTQESINNLQNLFIKKQGEVEFIEFVEGVAKDQGLEMKINTVSISASEKNTLKGVEYLVLRFTAVGTWDNIWVFSRMLEVFPYAVDVTSMALIYEDVPSDVKNTIPMWKGIYTIKVLKKK